MGSELAVQEQSPLQLILELEKAGACTVVSLDLTGEMPYERWEACGRLFGQIERSNRWWIGDWLLFGETVYGEESAQAVEATKQARTNPAEQVTGLEQQTIRNIMSLCSRVAKGRRRAELPFWTHAEVAALDPDEQVEWLDRAVRNGWSRAELRAEIREAKAAPADDPNEGGGDGDSGAGGGERETMCEQITRAANVVYKSWQPTSDGGYLVPAEAGAQLIAALGEE